MKYGEVPGVSKKISRLVLGSMIIDVNKLEESYTLLDDAISAGWNTIDTAHAYGAGDSERAIGRWMEDRGNREKIVIIGKGAAGIEDRSMLTTFDTTAHIYDTLSRLKTDYIDLWLFHRDDDPTQPVGPLVETLNEHLAAGRVRAIGCSNWAKERVMAANEYAYAHGLVPFVASSNNFGLAEQVVNPWGDGDVTLSGEKGKVEREFYMENKIAVFAWSSMARGFWSGRLNRENFESIKDTLDRACLRAYCHEINFRKLDRVELLAKHKGVTVPQIAVAYTINQPLNMFAIIGAASLQELQDNNAATEISMTREDLDWIDLKIDTHPEIG